MAKSNQASKKVSAPAPKMERGAKTTRAVEIVREQFTARAALIASGASVEGLESPRALSIAQIRVECFPGDNQKSARSTYFQIAYNTILEEGNKNAEAALLKGKPVYSVYNLHRAKMSRDKTKNLEGTVSAFGMVTSQAAAKELVKLLAADGFIKGVVTKDAKPLAA